MAAEGVFNIQDYLPQAQMPAAIPQPGGPNAPHFAPPPMPAPPTPSADAGGLGSGLMDAEALRMEAQLGRRLGADDLENLRKRFKEQQLPKFTPPKMEQWEYENFVKGFDSQYDEWANKYANTQLPGTAAAPRAEGLNPQFKDLWDIGVATAAGGVEAVGAGIPNMLDIAGRNLKGIWSAVKNYPGYVEEYFDRNIGPRAAMDRMMNRIQESRGERTTAGDVGDWVSKNVGEVRDYALSNDALAQRKAIAESWADDNQSVGQSIIKMMQNPLGAFTQVGEVAGGFLPQAAVLRMEKAATALQGMSPAMRRLAGATVIGAPQAANSVQDWANHVDTIPIETLMEDEDNQELVRTIQEYDPAVPQEKLETAVRNRVRGAGYDAVLATSVIANVGLAAMPFLRPVEQRLAGVVPGTIGKFGRTRGAVSGAASEAVEESAAGAIEQAGRNVGQIIGGDTSVDVSTGVGKSAGQGGTIGALVGAPIGFVTGSSTPRKPLKKTPAPTGQPAPASTATGAAGTATAAPAPVQAATANVAAPTPNAGFEGIRKAFTATMNEDARLIRGYKNATGLDAASLITQAEEDARTLAGDQWATLDRAQQVELVKTVAEAANKARGKNAIEGVDTAVTALLATTVPAAATPVAPVEDAAITPEESAILDALNVSPELRSGRSPADLRRMIQVAQKEIMEPDVPGVQMPMVPAQPAAVEPVAAPAPAAPAAVEPAAEPVAAEPAPVAPAAPRQQTPAQKQEAEAQRILGALAKWNEAADATTEGVRDMAEYGILLQAYKDGKITNTGELRAQLKIAQDTVKNAAPKVDWTVSGEGRTQRIGDLLAMKGRMKASVLAAKKNAQQAYDALVSMGMTPEQVNALNLKGAMDAYARLTGQGMRPAAGVTRPETPAPAPPKKTGAGKLATKGTKKPTQLVKPDGTVEIKSTTPEPQPVAGVNPRIHDLKDKQGRRINRGQQIEVQRLFDLVSRTGQYVADLRKAIMAYSGDADAAKALDDEAGEVFSKRADAGEEQQKAAKEKAAKEKPTTEPKKGRRANGVRDWIANLHQPGGEGVRIPEDTQKALESLYSRLLVRGGAPTELYNAVEQATGNADVAQEAADKYSKEFEGLGDTPTVLALAKLADVKISATNARSLTAIANEQGDAWRSTDGRTALEVAVDAARRMKADKLAAANKNVLRQAFDREASRPKTKAPAQSQASGAASSQKAQSGSQTQPEQSSEPSAAELAREVEPVFVEAQVLSILGEDAVNNSMVRDIADAIVQSRLDQKENGPALVKLVNGLHADGVIDLKEAMALRAAGKEVRLTAQDHTQQAENLPVPDVQPTSDLSVEGLAYTMAQTDNATTRSAIDAAVKLPLDQRATALLNMIAVQPDATAAERWLAGKLASVAGRLGIDVQWSKGENPSWGGWYNKPSNTVYFNHATPVTVLHEMLHAVTANLLTFGTDPKVKRLRNTLNDLMARVKEYAKQNPGSADEGLSRILASKRGPLHSEDEMLTYGMTESAFQEYLARIPVLGANRSVWDGFKKAVSDFFSPFTKPQKSVLDALIETTGQLVDIVEANPNLAIQANAESAKLPQSFAQANNLAILNDGPVEEGEETKLDLTVHDSAWRRFGVRYVDQTLGLEQVMQALVRAGHAIPKALNLTRAKIEYDGLRTEYTGEDTYTVITPVTDWLRQNLIQYGETREKAMENVNKFFRNKTQLNRYHMMWLENVKLLAGQDVKRQRILDEVRETSGRTEQDKLAKLRSDLERLVSQHAAQTEAEYGATRNSHYDRFREGLKELDTEWDINEQSMEELNTLMQAVRDRVQFRATAAGKADVDDPWITFYNDKYYVPLKGDSTVDNSVQDFDFGGVDHTFSLRILNAQIKAAKGTTKPLTNGIERLLVDNINMATRHAERHFTDVLYDFTQKFKKELGATVSVYEGRAKDGYTRISGKPMKGENEDGWRKNLPGAHGFTYSDGNRQYIVELPKDSDLLQTLREVYASTDSWAVTLLVGKATNFLSKSYTVWKPWWTLSTALIRDVTYVPTMLAAKEDSIAKGLGNMAKYYKALFANGMHPSNVPTAFSMIFANDPARVDELAASNPQKYVWWLREYQKHGGGGNIRAMYNQTGIRNSVTGAYDNADGLWALAIPVRKYDQFATGFGNLLEMTSRVAAFRAIVEDEAAAQGISTTQPSAELEAIMRDAAIDTKEVLNYDQQGIWSRGVNSYIAFFKVGMTSADAMRKTFTNPDGSFAKARFAKWASVFSMIAFAGMAMTRMLAGDDEEDGKNKLDKVSLNTLTQNFVVYIDGKPHKLPIGLGLPQLLLAPGIILEALMNGEVGASEAGRAMYEVFARNAPLRPGGLASDWTMGEFVNSWYSMFLPTVLQPIDQLSRNSSVFGQNIHRDFTGSEQYASEQGKLTTDDIWKDMAKNIRELTGNNVDAFPETYKHIFGSYLSHIPVDKIAKVAAAAEESEFSGPLAAAKEIAGVEVRDPEFYWARQLNTTSDDLLPAVQEFNLRKNQYLSEGMDDKAARSAAESWVNTQPVLGVQYRAYKALDKAQRAYYNDRKEIYRNKTLSTARKEAMMKRLDSELRKAVEQAQKSAP